MGSWPPLLPILVALLLPQVAESCSCVDSSLEELYCMSDWVAKVRVLERQNTARFPVGIREIIFTMQWLEVFKSPMGQTLPTRVRTNGSGSMCGLTDLWPNKEYLLSGSTSRNLSSASVDLCSSISRRWASVGEELACQLRNGTAIEEHCAREKERQKAEERESPPAVYYYNRWIRNLRRDLCRQRKAVSSPYCRHLLRPNFRMDSCSPTPYAPWPWP